MTVLSWPPFYGLDTYAKQQHPRSRRKYVMSGKRVCVCLVYMYGIHESCLMAPYEVCYVYLG